MSLKKVLMSIFGAFAVTVGAIFGFRKKKEVKQLKKAIDKFSNIVYRYHSGERKRIVQDVSKQRYLYKKKDFSEKVLMNVLSKYGSENVIGS